MLGSYRDMSPNVAWAHKPQKPSRRLKIARYVKTHSRIIFVVLLVVFLLSLFLDRNPAYLKRARYSFITTSSDDLPVAKGCSKSNPQNPCPRIAKVTVLIDQPDEIYERAMVLNEVHNQRFGYPHFVLRQRLLAGHWSKPAYLQQLLLAELAKPFDERLEWLVWMPADTVLLNTKIPLEMFLPPAVDWDHIHAMVANDEKGLNNGLLFLRVHEWSVWLMNACLATELIRPGLKVAADDEAAITFWINREKFRNNVIHVPPRWIDANVGYRGTGEISDPEEALVKFRAGSAREGDLLVRHVGSEAEKVREMQRWVEYAEKHSSRWEMDPHETTIPHDVEDYWRIEAPKERKKQDKLNAKLAAELKKKPPKKSPSRGNGRT